MKTNFVLSLMSFGSVYENMDELTVMSKKVLQENEKINKIWNDRKMSTPDNFDRFFITKGRLKAHLNFLNDQKAQLKTLMSIESSPLFSPARSDQARAKQELHLDILDAKGKIQILEEDLRSDLGDAALRSALRTYDRIQENEAKLSVIHIKVLLEGYKLKKLWKLCTWYQSENLSAIRLKMLYMTFPFRQQTKYCSMIKISDRLSSTYDLNAATLVHVKAHVNFLRDQKEQLKHLHLKKSSPDTSHTRTYRKHKKAIVHDLKSTIKCAKSKIKTLEADMQSVKNPSKAIKDLWASIFLQILPT